MTDDETRAIGTALKEDYVEILDLKLVDGDVEALKSKADNFKPDALIDAFRMKLVRCEQREEFLKYSPPPNIIRINQCA